MVAIFEKANGLKFVAVSADERTAKQAIYDRYCNDKEWYNDVDEWWNRGRDLMSGAPWAFEIKEVEEW